MVLNYIWIGFILVSFVLALAQLLLGGNPQFFTDIVTSTFDSAKTGFQISIGLTGVLSLWLGIMKIGEKGGVIQFFSKLVAPFFTKIFPEIPKDHPALGSIFMNISANMLGLGNAATPMGLKAMKEMQEINKDKSTASNAMIMFLVINTAGLTLIPINTMVYRAQAGAANPSDVFLPIMLATFCSTLIGFLSVAVYQKINIFNKTILGTLLGLGAVIGSAIYFLGKLPQAQISSISSLVSSVILLSIIVSFVLTATIKKINVYEAFIDGAKEGFNVAIGIIPYLIGILVAIGMFRASGAMDVTISGITRFFNYIGVNADFVGALPTAMMKPLSGSGASGMMVDAMKTFGADSFIGRIACIIQGSADTTFYIIAVYFGSVGIKRTRNALTFGLIADFAGITAAILLGYLFFH